MIQEYDIIVVGAGHAGTEAALISARRQYNTLLVTSNVDNIGAMSCNPAIGGLAKGHLVREIDVLGGEMAKAIDHAGIQFRMLNMSKGYSVRGPRAQADRKLYKSYIKTIIENEPNLDLIQDMATGIIVEKDICKGIETRWNGKIYSKLVILTPGTFLNGVIHIGEKTIPAGRFGDEPSNELSKSLKDNGLSLSRLKTGTTPRLDANTIDFSKCIVQKGDDNPVRFSFKTKNKLENKINCYITYTNKTAHKIMSDNITKSALYSGKIVGIGPRYCPSIEVKIKQFPDKEKHQLFLEPEGLDTKEIYVNGFATSFPIDIQYQALQCITGLEKCRIVRPGYAIEYDFVPPTQMKYNLETKKITNLFLAGQINGTSGYEEAGALGIYAGINAANKIEGLEPFILKRSESYTGVLVDDLITKGTEEPYRMFTSRAEYRLMLRHDNADLRLMEYTKKYNLCSDTEWTEFQKYKTDIKKLKEFVKNNKVTYHINDNNKTSTLSDYIRIKQPELNDFFNMLKEDYDIEYNIRVVEQVFIDELYRGYIKRQNELINKMEKLDNMKIPEYFDYMKVNGISTEAKQKLICIKPDSIGQAKRISGITPSDINVLIIYIKNKI